MRCLHPLVNMLVTSGAVLVGCVVLPAFAATTRPTAAHAATARGDGAVMPDPAPARAVPSVTYRRVFTCIAPDLVTHSDRPCGPAPVLRSLMLTTPPIAAGQASNITPEPAPAATRSGSRATAAADPTAKRDDRPAEKALVCARLEAAVRSLDDRMRTGYSAREAGRLWSRWREAKARVHEADC